MARRLQRSPRPQLGAGLSEGRRTSWPGNTMNGFRDRQVAGGELAAPRSTPTLRNTPSFRRCRAVAFRSAMKSSGPRGAPLDVWWSARSEFLGIRSSV
jgi:hypothetical protein